MYTLRCTQKLLKRMRLTVADLRGAEIPEPTTALGDWYANLLLIQRQHMVMLVSDRSRLCVLVPARDIDRLRARFEHALMELLRDLDVPEEALVREGQAMGQMCYGLTTAPNGRSVLGSMNDYTNALQYSDMGDRTLSEWNLYFSEWISGPLDYGHPSEAAKRLLMEGPSLRAADPGNL
jgi:hypothetical protein